MTDIKKYASYVKQELPVPKYLNDEEYSSIIKRFRYSYQKFNYNKNGKSRTWYAMVIRDNDSELIVKFTGYEDVLYSRSEEDFTKRYPRKAEILCLCQFFQYVFIDNYKIYKIRDITQITRKMVENWIDDYATTVLPSGEFPREKTVEVHRNTICQFLYMVCRMLKRKMKHLKKDDLLKKVYDVGGEKGGPRMQPFYRIRATSYDVDTGLQRLIRDMPVAIIPIFLRIAERDDPEIVFAVILSCYMGFREGEVCNTRQDGSYFGKSFYFTRDFGEATALQVDLGDEFALRSDGVEIGKIKRERYSGAFTNFVKVISYYYDKHMELIKDKPCEDSMPMFLNKYKDSKTGVYMAMTNENYAKRIQKILDRVLECCRYSDNLDLQRFYDKMVAFNSSWGAHAFRHWFSVRLLQYGCDWKQLMYYRGDNDERSAIDYVNNKDELLKDFEDTNEELGFLIKEVRRR